MQIERDSRIVRRRRELKVDKPKVRDLIEGGVMIGTVPGLTAALAAKQATATLAATVQAYTLDQFADPVAAMNFNAQQAINFVIENRTSDPASPVTGSIWLRTDL